VPHKASRSADAKEVRLGTSNFRRMASPRYLYRFAVAGFDLSILPNTHAESPGGLALAHAPTFAIAPEHLGERRHEARLEAAADAAPGVQSLGGAAFERASRPLHRVQSQPV